MKKIAFIAFLLFATTLVFAQRPEGRGQFSAEDIAKRATDWMKTELKLTEAQIAPVDSINLYYAKAQIALMQSANGDREKMREASTDLNAKKDKALAPVLTKEQMDLYKKTMSERGGRGFGNNGDRPRNNN